MSNNCFDDIPEDRERSYPCEVPGCKGTITRDEQEIDMKWQCDTCHRVMGDFMQQQKEKVMIVGETEMSWEERIASYRMAAAKDQEEREEALQVLTKKMPLTPEEQQRIWEILELRKCNILNLCGIIDEYNVMPCNSTEAKFKDATIRYGKLT